MSVYIGENIRKLRKKRELTQETLANFLGVSYQSVSKWERGDSYPDITLLPSIASFFDVSVDDLLGVDQSKKEEKIQSYIHEYEVLYFKDTPKAFETINRALKEFPGDFRLIIRYMTALLSTKGGIHDKIIDIYDEMTTLNESIQQHCTSDSIRIRAKRLMGTYYKSLSYTEKDESYITKMEEINNDLPVMRDSRDYTATHMYPPGEKHNTACRTAIEELIFLLDGATCNYCFYDDGFSPEFKIKAAEIIITVMDTIYDDGNYGQNWHYIVYNYGHIGLWYFQAGNTEKAYDNFKKAAELACEYDLLPDETTLNSHLLDGVLFKKTVRGKTMRERMKHHFTVNYPLSEEFKASAEFKEILSILG